MKKDRKWVSLNLKVNVVIMLIVLVLANNTPIEVNLPHFTAEELAEQKKAASQAAKAAYRKQRISKMYVCQTDDDCAIVDKDPCGCLIGPKGVTAINVGYITDFDEINNKAFGTRTCPEQTSAEKECSPSAHPVCRAKRCKIAY